MYDELKLLHHSQILEYTGMGTVVIWNPLRQEDESVYQTGHASWAYNFLNALELGEEDLEDYSSYLSLEAICQDFTSLEKRWVKCSPYSQRRAELLLSTSQVDYLEYPGDLLNFNNLLVNLAERIDLNTFRD